MTELLQKAKSWLIVLIPCALGLLLLLWLRSRGQTEAALKLGGDLVEKWHTRDVAATQQKINELSSDAAKNGAEISKLQSQIASTKQTLDRAYVQQGLSSIEIAERFKRLDI
jgi:hypothetical protein